MRRSDELGLVAVGFTRREALQRSAAVVGSLALSGILPSRGEAASVGSGREVIRDPHFQRGVTVLDPKPGKRVPFGVLAGHVRGEKPVWDLAQWSSKHPLQLGPPQPLASKALRYSNSAKAVTLGQPDTEDADLSLRVNGSVEYDRGARRDGEPWVHLLLQQDIENPSALPELSAAQLRVEARLKSSKRIDAADYSPNRHAAQFQIFFSVQNLNRQSPGYGQNLWDGKLLAHHLALHYHLTLGVRQCQRLFGQFGFRRRKPRPVIAKGDPAEQAAYKKTPPPGPQRRT